MTVGDKIRIARNMLGWTQKELGFVTKESDSRIRQYELGIRVPSRKKIIDLAGALGVPASFLAANNTDTNIEIMYYLFELESLKKITISNDGDGGSILITDPDLRYRVEYWGKQKEAYENCTLEAKDYEEWKIKYAKVFPPHLGEMNQMPLEEKTEDSSD
ncbi:helix-turn-helix transcriptional regulator [Oscillibacter sp.]|uniref:helix-turn-helix domain-containing protein n=1 Tax=Oscillibacter sp. TaxID=1945593 RepID=UPI0028A0C708|nr:helix-turn-helix transcriptional regulator [Oscillibacter sp.]